MSATLRRKALSLVYEALLLAALLWCAALVFGSIERQAALNHSRPLFQAYLLVVTGAYFIWQWTHGGQTLPMKTWGLRLVPVHGAVVTPRQACVRYAVALAGTMCLGLGFVWALVDRERRFLHDRLAATRIIRTEISVVPATTSSPPPVRGKRT